MALTDKLTAIGDAIRQKTGSTELIPLSDMPSEIDMIYEKGAEAEYDAFWDSFQRNGARSSYEHGFQAWRGVCFKPKYDLILSGEYNTNTFRQARDFDLKKMTIDRGLAFDTSGATVLNGTFQQSAIGNIPPIDLSSCTRLLSTFNSMAKETDYTTTTLVLNNIREDCTFQNVFTSAPYFESIMVSGTIGQNGFNVSGCRGLNKASITSIINALSDKTSGLSVTLSKAAVSNAFGTKIDVTLSAVQSDGYYNVTSPSLGGADMLSFSVPMEVEFWGHYPVDGEWYETNISKSGVSTFDLWSLRDYTFDYSLRIKRTDGGELSGADVAAYALDEDWYTLVYGNKSNWTINLI